MRRAAMQNIMARYGSLVLTLMSTVVLARLLTPRDFGLAALINLSSGLFVILGTAGLSSSVVQFRGLSDADIRRLFGLSVSIACCCSIAFVIVGLSLSELLRESAYLGLAIVSSVTLLFSISNAVPNGLLLRR